MTRANDSLRLIQEAGRPGRTGHSKGEILSIAIPQRYLMARGISSVLNYLHIDLVAAVVALLLLAATGLAKTPDLAPVFERAFPGTNATAESSAPNQQIASSDRRLSQAMAGALDFVAQRYRVAPDGLLPVFETVQLAARERNLDPLLIVAIIGIESGFNPFAQSQMGAQGLMQIIPRYHQDKLNSRSAASSFLDPVINVTIGARILQESIHRQGGLMEGLQHYAGATEDPDQGYANKVLAEKQRLEQSARRKQIPNG